MMPLSTTYSTPLKNQSEEETSVKFRSVFSVVSLSLSSSLSVSSVVLPSSLNVTVTVTSQFAMRKVYLLSLSSTFFASILSPSSSTISILSTS